MSKKKKNFGSNVTPLFDPVQHNPAPHPVHLWDATGEIEPARKKRILAGEVLQELVTLTPDICCKIVDHYLRTNKALGAKNREKQDENVKKFAAMLEGGEVIDAVSQGISFSSEGWLQNGQHRAWACGLSTVSFKSFVCFNESPKALKVLDKITARKPEVRMQLGFGLSWVTSHHMSVVNTILDHRVITESVIADYLTLHEEDLRNVVAMFAGKRPFKGAFPQALIGVVYRAWVQPKADHERLREFGKILVSGLTESNGDWAACKLRDYMQRANERDYVLAAKSRHHVDASRIAKRDVTRTAVLAFLKKRPLKTLKPTTQEPFPIPEDNGGGVLHRVKSVSKNTREEISKRFSDAEKRTGENPNLAS